MKGVKRTSNSYIDPVNSERLLERRQVPKTQDVAAQNMHYEACAKSPAPEPIIHKVNTICYIFTGCIPCHKESHQYRVTEFKTCAPRMEAIWATQFEVSTRGRVPRGVTVPD